MTALVIAVVIGLAVLAGALGGKYLRIPAPWIWIVAGAVLSFVPGLHQVSLPSEVVIFLFLPVLLYWETLSTSFQLIRANLRVILLLGIGLVFVTAAVIAGLGHMLGLAWPIAIVLGAVISPTDATAVATMAPHLPRRPATVLRAESLINDASALALWTVAVGAIAAGTAVQPLDISLRFVWAVVGGVLGGIVFGFVCVLLRKIARRTDIADVVGVLSPFLLYLPAEAVNASGVVAVVVGALLLGRFSPRISTAAARNEGFSFFRVTTYLINGGLFVLIGLQARPVFETFVGDGWRQVLTLSAVAAIAVFAVRFLWIQLTTVLIRALDRRDSQRARRAPFRQRLVSSWGGFRGAVSLAAALAIPVETMDGVRIPERETVIAVTFVVVVVTIFLQGATMPAVVRRARFEEDRAEQDELHLVHIAPLETALEHLDEDAQEAGVSEEVSRHVRDMLEHRLELVRSNGPGEDEDEQRPDRAKARLQLAVLARKREAAISLRDEGRIDDGVLLSAQQRFDLEELRLTAETAG